MKAKRPIVSCKGTHDGKPCSNGLHEHHTGLCTVCRQPYGCDQTKPKRARKARKSTRQAPAGSLEWAESRGGLIGGYEED
jgi:hypothetical protein